MTAAERAHQASCKFCQGVAKMRPEPVLPGRPRNSSASLRTSPLRFRKKGVGA